jgi:hypothetical protein
MNLKAGVAVAIAAVLLFIIVPRNNSGTHFSAKVTEYDCRIKVQDDPRSFQKQALATLSVQCATPPKQATLSMLLQYRDKSSDPWTNVGQPKGLAGQPTPDAVTVDVADPCKGGDWRVAYQLSGVANATDRAFQEPEQFGDPKTISAAQCANS